MTSVCNNILPHPWLTVTADGAHIEGVLHAGDIHDKASVMKMIKNKSPMSRLVMRMQDASLVNVAM